MASTKKNIHPRSDTPKSVNPDRDPVTGRFAQGNDLWRIAADRAGRPLKFETPEILWRYCVEYFEWASANPLYEDKLVTYEGSATHEPVAHLRALTAGALCVYLGIDLHTWIEYRKRPVFAQVVTRAETVIRAQKFEGAAADLLNASIIARDLGLSDSVGIGQAPGLAPINTGAEDAARIIAERLDRIAAAQNGAKK